MRLSISIFILCFFILKSGYTQTEQNVEASFIYSYYEQDGNNGAVTGGIGTEKLNYHAPSIVLNIPVDSLTAFHFSGGVDIYSSASTDNIDFNVSSASAMDARSHFRIGMSHIKPNQKIDFEYHGDFSIESDYTSLGIGASVSKGFNNYNTILFGGFQFYYDDCRWGRLSFEKELKLLYPEELRFREWEDQYLRQTYSLSLSVSQVINKRMNASLFTEIALQNGLLATTFHRVYFADDPQHRIEKLPYQRLKLPIGFRLNYFMNKNVVFRSYYRFYYDDWNIKAHSVELEIPWKINAFFSVYPFYRYHVQSSAFWFNPYQEHLSSQDFFTSDYDLSAFSAHKYGAGIYWWPAKSNIGFQFRAGVYNRSTGLDAFFTSIVLDYRKKD